MPRALHSQEAVHFRVYLVEYMTLIDADIIGHDCGMDWRYVGDEQVTLCSHYSYE